MVRGCPRQSSIFARMTETQREPVPRNDADELDTAVAFLRFARESVLKKTDGLNDEQLRRVLVDTGTTLLGLVEHLAGVERYWFGYHLTGADPDGDSATDVAGDGSTESVLQAYRDAIADSDRAIERAGDPNTRVARPVDGEHLTLRWVLAHMTSETARHAGHADILREQIDGTTGR
jgi:uncharacterized damage-inducible protein DinB